MTKWFKIKAAVQRNWDELVILGASAKVAFQPSAELTGQDRTILEAFRRSSPQFENASVEEIGRHLEGLEEEQIAGLANNVKGIAHEITFVETENADGDTVTAELFLETNHTGTDVAFTDSASGESWEAQLKATDSTSYAQEWIDKNPDGQIIVTEELAEKMGLESSGIANQDLTMGVDDFVDKALTNETMWDYFPMISVAVLSVAIYSLFRRYQRGELKRDEFLKAAAKLTGWKMAKVVALSALLSMPVVNVVVTTALVAKVLRSGLKIFRRVETKLLPSRGLA